MEVKDLTSALKAAILLLRRSESSFYTSMEVEEIIASLEDELEKLKNSEKIDYSRLQNLFAPTGPIQETSIDNGWGNEFLGISKIIDQFTDSTRN